MFLSSSLPSENSLAVLALGKYPRLQQVCCGRKKKQKPWQQFLQLEIILAMSVYAQSIQILSPESK